MAYKRNIDRLPIPPRDAQVHNVVCHFCIVGCGYHALSWPVDRQGGTQPGQNAFNAGPEQAAGRRWRPPGSARRCTTSSSRMVAT